MSPYQDLVGVIRASGTAGPDGPSGATLVGRKSGDSTSQARLAQLSEYLDVEVDWIAKLEVRPRAEARRLLILAGIRAYNTGTELRATLPEKVLERPSRFLRAIGLLSE